MKTFKQFYEDKQTQSVDNWDKVVANSEELKAATDILRVINNKVLSMIRVIDKTRY